MISETQRAWQEARAKYFKPRPPKPSPPTTMTITKTPSILPNSSPRILQPIICAHGTCQIQWFPDLNSHGLLFQYHDSGDVVLLALHNNGHSCYGLAENIKARDLPRAIACLEGIRNCGGLGVSQHVITYVITGA